MTGKVGRAGWGRANNLSGCHSYPKGNGLTGDEPSVVLRGSPPIYGNDWFGCGLGLGGNPGSLGKPKGHKTMQYPRNQQSSGLHGALTGDGEGRCTVRQGSSAHISNCAPFQWSRQDSLGQVAVWWPFIPE